MWFKKKKKSTPEERKEMVTKAINMLEGGKPLVVPGDFPPEELARVIQYAHDLEMMKHKQHSLKVWKERRKNRKWCNT